ncbi:MAG: hypothetical protein K0Q73_8305 [Paenibacillus sp.]|jgi:N-acetyl-anhydromuramyl-L-alanine amidase AmpD|nr:hypothetical protein [Paenibacillus sp.]
MAIREIIWKGNKHTNSNDRGDWVPFVIVNHISAGTMGSMDNWFQSPNNKVSSAHFGVARDGRIHQYVKMERMAWANGLNIANNLRRASAPVVYDLKVNPNLYSVSIEHEGYDGELTKEQYQASLWLHRYIQQYIFEHWGKQFPLDEYHVIGHFQIDKVNKPNCPGPKFPWVRLYEDLKQQQEEDDEMLKEQVEELKGQVQTLMNTADVHIKKINALEAQLADQEAPEWFTKEFGTKALDGVVDTPQGPNVFWRLVTVVYRLANKTQ